MATPRGALRQYILENQQLPADVMLGHLVWYTVPEQPYSPEKIAEAFTEFDLDSAFQPGRINPANAYEKATQEAAGDKYTVALPDGTKGVAEILVRQAHRGEHQIIRQLIREIKSEDSRKRLSYEPVAEIVFYRPTSVNGKVEMSTANVRSTFLPATQGSERDRIAKSIAAFDAAFDRHRNNYDSARVRQVFRDYLKHLNGLEMKPSVYFVHSRHSDELHRLEKLAGVLGISLSLWQIPDTQKKREEIIEAFQDEADTEFANVVTAIQKLRATRRTGITAEAYAKIREEYQAIMDKAGEYARTLQINQDRTAASAEIAMEALEALKVDVYESLAVT